MPKSVPIGDAVVNLGALTLLLQGLRTGNGDLISDGMHDRLHEPYRWRLIKGGQEVKEAALAAGAWGCAISGAGPSILALCAEENGQAGFQEVEQMALYQDMVAYQEEVRDPARVAEVLNRVILAAKRPPMHLGPNGIDHTYII